MNKINRKSKVAVDELSENKSNKTSTMGNSNGYNTL